ncbi:MAG TPA: hypothetical protein DIT04_12670 [Dysgonomonas sp.]|nr:hypothetical protein [Dysgonomonas sp.]
MPNSETVKERLIEYLSYKGISQYKFQESIGASNGYINSMRKGIGVDKLEQVRSKYPDLDIKWLLTGDGTMLRQSDENSASSSISVDGSVSFIIKKEDNGNLVISDGIEEILIPSEFPKEIYTRILQMFARQKRLEQENEQLKKDKAILQEFVTFLQKDKK